jgi:hypothetical protein
MEENCNNILALGIGEHLSEEEGEEDASERIRSVPVLQVTWH